MNKKPKPDPRPEVVRLFEWMKSKGITLQDAEGPVSERVVIREWDIFKNQETDEMKQWLQSRSDRYLCTLCDGYGYPFCALHDSPRK